jgi:acetyl-CoA carboxylase biotin carboxyl carrier protein
VADVVAPVTGSVWKIVVPVGSSVREYDEIIVLESMKMEIPVVAPIAGVVTAIHVNAEQSVSEGQVLATVEPS